MLFTLITSAMGLNGCLRDVDVDVDVFIRVEVEGRSSRGTDPAPVALNAYSVAKH